MGHISRGQHRRGFCSSNLAATLTCQAGVEPMHPAAACWHFAHQSRPGYRRAAQRVPSTPKVWAWLKASHLTALGLLIAFQNAAALGLQVVPSVGRAGGHIVVSGGGLMGPVECGPPFGVVKIDGYGFGTGTFTYSVPAGAAGFSIDLANVPGQPPGLECVSCLLGAGVRTVRFYGGGECTSEAYTLGPVCTTFEIVSGPANGDPWASDLQVVQLQYPNGVILGEGMKITFSPIGVQDVPLCDSILTIQSCRMRGFRAPGDTVDLSFADVNWIPLLDLPGMEETMTPGPVLVSIDIHSDLGQPYTNTPAAEAPLGLVGRKESALGSLARFADAPSGFDDLDYPAGVVRLILDFEVNVFCADGDGQGQWLGKTFWLWERDLGRPPSFRPNPGLPHDRGQPTPKFFQALEIWSAARRFALPKLPEPPNSGGIPCN